MILVIDTDGTDGDVDIFQVSTGTYREGKRDAGSGREHASQNVDHELSPTHYVGITATRPQA